MKIAERCTFDLTSDLAYTFPDYPAPDGHTPESYLEKLCYEAAVRRYGSITRSSPHPAGRRVPADQQIQPGRLPADVPRSHQAGARGHDRAGTDRSLPDRWRRTRRAGDAAPRYPCWPAISSAFRTSTP